MNPIFRGDSYKFSQFRQYPPGMTYLSSYIEARSGQDILFFGLSPYLRALSTRVTHEDIDIARVMMKKHGEPFNEEGFRRIVTDFGGRLPLSIQALPEGTIVPAGVPMVQVRNTAPGFGWLVSPIETTLLRAVWYPTTVASKSFAIRRKILEHLTYSADDPMSEIEFKLHDFGARGASSTESAGIGGTAHLVNFHGTDNVDALYFASEYYGENVAGYSIPAAEHSTITAWGRDGEADAYGNMLDVNADYPMVAVVSDSYDIYNACRSVWGGALRERVKALGDSGRTLVIRPDSGDPVHVVSTVLDILWERFGGTLNTKGFRVLPPFLRVLQGDGIDLTSVGQILGAMNLQGYSASNIAFGMGGALLQQVNRDTYSFAMKANEIEIGDTKRAIYKQPKTDAAKSSKMGRQAVVKRDGRFLSVAEDALGSERNHLREVWRDGNHINMPSSLAVVRKLVREQEHLL